MIQSADMGMDAQGTGWGWLAPSTQVETMPGCVIGIWSRVQQLSKLSKGQVRRLGRVVEKWLTWVQGFVRVEHEAD